MELEAKVKPCQALLFFHSVPGWNTKGSSCRTMLEDTLHLMPSHITTTYFTIVVNDKREVGCVRWFRNIPGKFTQYFDFNRLNFIITKSLTKQPEVSSWYTQCFGCMTFHDTKIYFDLKNLEKGPIQFREYVDATFKNVFRHLSFFTVNGLDRILYSPEYMIAARKVREKGKMTFTQRIVVDFYQQVIFGIVFEKFSNSTFPVISNNGFADGARQWASIVYLDIALMTCYGCLPLRSDSFRFVSCYGTVNTLTIRIYTQPFAHSVWLAILICAVLTGLVLQFESRRGFWNRLEVFMQPIKSLLEVVDLTEKSIPCVAKLNFVMGSWLLLTVVLSNAYRGVIISELAAEKPVQGLTTFDALENMEIMPAIMPQFVNLAASWVNDRINRPSTDTIYIGNDTRIFPSTTIGWSIGWILEPILTLHENFVRKYDPKLMFIFERLVLPGMFGKVTMGEELSKCN
ncbi:unnamed protein product, partial [Allacma fusca]